MKINIKLLIMLSLIMVAIPFTLLYINKKSASSEHGSIFERKVKKNTFKLARTFKIDFNASQIKYHRGKLFAYNQEGIQIIQMDTTGNIEKVHGQYSNNTSKFQLVIGYDVNASGLYAIDARKYSLMHFDLNNSELIDSTSINKKFGRAAYIGDGQLIIASYDSQRLNMNFDIYDSNKKMLKQGPNGYKKYNDGGFATDGFFVKSTDTSYFHVSHHLSNFFKFTTQGKVMYVGKTIENLQTPPKSILNEGIRYLAPNSSITTIDACADANQLYVISAQSATNDDEKEISDKNIIDVYSTDNGNYKYSFYLPEFNGSKIRTIAKSPNGFFCVQGYNITYYEKI